MDLAQGYRAIGSRATTAQQRGLTATSFQQPAAASTAFNVGPPSPAASNLSALDMAFFGNHDDSSDQFSNFRGVSPFGAGNSNMRPPPPGPRQPSPGTSSGFRNPFLAARSPSAGVPDVASVIAQSPSPGNGASAGNNNNNNVQPFQFGVGPAPAANNAQPFQFGAGPAPAADNGNPGFRLINGVPHSSVVLPDNVNADAGTAANPYFYGSGFAPAFQLPPVPADWMDEPFHFNPFARFGTWSSLPDPNRVLPNDVFTSLDHHMWTAGVLNETDRMWIMGVQYGIGLGITSYKESLLDELEVEGRIFGRPFPGDHPLDSSLTMPHKIADRSLQSFDRVQAHKAATKFLAASEVLAQAIIEKGFEAVLPPNGGYVAAPGLFPHNPEAQAHTSSLNGRLASDINQPPRGDPNPSLNADPRALLGPRTIAEHLPEYRGISARGDARHDEFANLIDNAIAANSIPEGMRNFAPPPEALLFTDEDFRQIREAAAAEVASRGQNNGNGNGNGNGGASGNAQMGGAPGYGQQQQQHGGPIGEVSNRTMGNQPQLSETPSGHAFISVPRDM